jgi:dolichyl-phosphate beta-glucosyltransferase
VRLSIVVPAYNEEARIERTLARLHEYYSAQDYAYNILIVSDGSTDRTVQIATEFASKHPQFRVIECPINRGKGAVVREGMLAADGDFILFCDADLATPQEETEKLLPIVLAGKDIAIGSRPLKESKLEIRQPWYREMLGRSFNGAVQLLAVRGIADTQCGFKLFKRDVAHDIFRRCRINGFSFDLEVLMIARDLNYSIAEIPIRWMHQEGSKVRVLRDGLRMLRDLVMLRLKGRGNRIKLRDDLAP